MPSPGSKRFSADAKRALAEAKVVQSEVNGLLSKIATNAAFASKLHDAIDSDDKRAVIKYLKPGCFKRSKISSLELFPGNLRVKLTVDFKRMRFSIEIET